MSNAKDYPNSGILFRDADKRDEKSRDYRGEGDITCPHCGSRFTIWLSGWIKSGRKGKFLGLSFKAKDRQAREDAHHGRV
jgi:hypothetical protein